MLQKVLQKSDFPMFRAAASAVSRLRRAGFAAYFAGGAVRDLLLGKTPHDIDIATSAVPDAVIRLFPESHPIGKAFGVVTICVDGFAFETATFRTEGGYFDGRHPTLLDYAGSPEEDVQRRDFTINGMMLDPESGEVLDFVGGLADLHSGIIRAIGDPAERFREDALRILRAVRFHARYDFELDPATLAAASELAERLSLLSPERIFTEIQKILTGPRPDRAFRTLKQIGALKVILPEIHALSGVHQPPQYHPEGDVFEHTMLMLTKMAHPSSELAWSVLLHDIGKPATHTVEPGGRDRFFGHEAVGARMAVSILSRLHASNTLIETVHSAVADHMRFAFVDKMKRSKLLQLIARPEFSVSLELHRIDCSSSNGMLGNYVLLLDVLTDLAGKPAIPPPLITGRDLIQLGFKPGVLFSKILNQVAELQLEENLTTRDEALAFVRKNY